MQKAATDEGFSIEKMESGVDFKEVSSDNVKIESIQVKAGENGFNSYQSPELKRKQVFKHYNNTYMYVSFREQFIAKSEEEVKADKQTVRELYRIAVFDYLMSAQSFDGKLEGVNLTNVTLKQAFESHVVITVDDLKDQKKIANNLKLRKEVLAVEWLDKKKLFGDRASIDEMSAFKSRVKK